MAAEPSATTTCLHLSTSYSKKAAKQHGGPEDEIVVGEIAVGYHAEMIGTIRGWEATASVGRKRDETTQ